MFSLMLIMIVWAEMTISKLGNASRSFGVRAGPFHRTNKDIDKLTPLAKYCKLQPSVV